MKNIICVKWGPKYIPEYVNILKNMCKRQSTVDFKFSCITDDETGLDEDINIIKFPCSPPRSPTPNLRERYKRTLMGKECWRGRKIISINMHDCFIVPIRI